MLGNDVKFEDQLVSNYVKDVNWATTLVMMSSLSIYLNLTIWLILGFNFFYQWCQANHLHIRNIIKDVISLVIISNLSIDLYLTLSKI